MDWWCVQSEGGSSRKVGDQEKEMSKAAIAAHLEKIQSFFD